MIVKAPWTEDQVARLNEWQTCGLVHPFTCVYRGDEEHGDDESVMEATTQGWVCPICNCMQNWTHDFMLMGAPPKPTFSE